MLNAQSKRHLEKTLRAGGFGQGTAKKIVSLIDTVLEGRVKKSEDEKANANHRR